MFDFLDAAKKVAALEAKATEVGLSLVLSEDFQELEREANALKGHLMPVFRYRESEAGPHNAFWMKGVDEDGAIRHIQAVRVIDLGCMSLNGYLDRFTHLYINPEPDDLDRIALDRSSYWPSETLDGIRGKAVYHGDIWIDPVYRGRDLASVLPPMAVLLATMRWSPDFFYGLLISSLARHGIHIRYGYHHYHPCAFRWRNAQGRLVRDDGLVWASRREVADMLKLERESPIPAS